VNHRVLSRLMWISGFSVARAILVGHFFIDYVPRSSWQAKRELNLLHYRIILEKIWHNQRGLKTLEARRVTFAGSDILLQASATQITP